MYKLLGGMIIKFIVSQWRHMATEVFADIDSGNSLVSIRQQAIAWINVEWFELNHQERISVKLESK